MLLNDVEGRVLIALIVVTVATAGLCNPISRDVYRWHDSSQFSRVIVNASDGIQMRPKRWFAEDKLISDFTVANVDPVGRVKAVQEYELSLIHI